MSSNRLTISKDWTRCLSGKNKRPVKGFLKEVVISDTALLMSKVCSIRLIYQICVTYKKIGLTQKSMHGKKHLK